MSNEKTYDGQTASFLATVATCMPKNLSGEVMQGWIENPKALQNFLSGLCPGGGVDLDEFFKPYEFFKIRKDLWRSENFEKFILSVAQKIRRFELPDHITGFDLPEDMADEKIRAKLGDNHVFSADEGCFVIAEMISRQANGEKGDLLSNGSANIFYLRGKDNEVRAVDVYWVADDRSWDVRAYRLDVSSCYVGSRAFSCNSIFDK